MYLLIDLYYIFTLVILQYLLHICVLLLFILWRLNKIQSINQYSSKIKINSLDSCPSVPFLISQFVVFSRSHQFETFGCPLVWTIVDDYQFAVTAPFLPFWTMLDSQAM